jgi:hypothetical protein
VRNRTPERFLDERGNSLAFGEYGLELGEELRLDVHEWQICGFHESEA